MMDCSLIGTDWGASVVGGKGSAVIFIRANITCVDTSTSKNKHAMSADCMHACTQSATGTAVG